VTSAGAAIRRARCGTSPASACTNRRASARHCRPSFFSGGILPRSFWLFPICPLTKEPKPPLRKTPQTLETPFFGLPLPSSAPFSTFFVVTSRCAQSAVLLAAVVAAPPRRNAKADARRGRGASTAIDLNKILVLSSRLIPLRQGHQLKGGTVRARP
jgi:hypothetical protein